MFVHCGSFHMLTIFYWINTDHFHVSEPKVKVILEAQSWYFGLFLPSLTSYKTHKYQFLQKWAFFLHQCILDYYFIKLEQHIYYRHIMAKHLKIQFFCSIFTNPAKKSDLLKNSTKIILFCMLFLSLHNQKRFSALFIHIYYLDLEYDNLKKKNFKNHKMKVQE